MRIVSFMSQKGGVGKSTACVNLAAVLAERGYRVLILDLDANACASQTFGAVGGPENSIAAALLGEHPLPSLARLRLKLTRVGGCAPAVGTQRVPVAGNPTRLYNNRR
jgi:cellulose biosynthesis protein BcsQ